MYYSRPEAVVCVCAYSYYVVVCGLNLPGTAGGGSTLPDDGEGEVTV